MTEVVREALGNAQQEYWQAPALPQSEVEAALPLPPQSMAEVCADCGSEFMIEARFCHACGLARPRVAGAAAKENIGFWNRNLAAARVRLNSIGSGWLAPVLSEISFPRWMRYLHFHEIKRWIGLPMPSLIAFIVGLGCVAGVIGVSLFYKASNLAEFQAIQMWRIEWLLGATAAFVAGILLKKPSGPDQE